MLRLGETASAGLVRMHRVVGEHEGSLADGLGRQLAFGTWHLAIQDRAGR
jgi:hypothetical protein